MAHSRGCSYWHGRCWSQLFGLEASLWGHEGLKTWPWGITSWRDPRNLEENVWKQPMKYKALLQEESPLGSGQFGLRWGADSWGPLVFIGTGVLCQVCDCGLLAHKLQADLLPTAPPQPAAHPQASASSLSRAGREDTLHKRQKGLQGRTLKWNI